MRLRAKGGVAISPVLIAGILIVIVGGIVTFVMHQKANHSYGSVTDSTHTQQSTPTATAALSADTQLGQDFSHGHCSGTGSKPLGSAPMTINDIAVIEPYGLMVGGHVTPVDHQYYYPKDFQKGFRDTASVLAPADGVITEIGHRGDKLNTPIGATDVPSSDEYRIVITYSCTFFSYVDLVTSLDPAIKSQLPSTWTSTGNWGTNIPVKQGQVIGKVGGQSLDFAVWDVTKSLPNLLVADAYNNAEPWKIHTVKPLDFFTAAVKEQVLPYYARSVEPLDGNLAYDIDGKLIGTWFKKGTNGYAGSTTPGLTTGYWTGHLSIAPNFLDPTALEVSIGGYPGGAAQFAVKRGSTDAATVGVETGLVKYELGGMDFTDSTGASWHFDKPAKGITMLDPTTIKATVLFQLTEKRALKMEVFPGKTAAQVTAFDDNAVMYDRGDGATTLKSNTATN